MFYFSTNCLRTFTLFQLSIKGPRATHSHKPVLLQPQYTQPESEGQHHSLSQMSRAYSEEFHQKAATELTHNHNMLELELCTDIYITCKSLCHIRKHNLILISDLYTYLNPLSNIMMTVVAVATIMKNSIVTATGACTKNSMQVPYI